MKIVALFVLFMIALTSASHALLLCSVWGGASTAWAYSPSDGWGNVYTWYTSAIQVPTCGNFSVNVQQTRGDNDGQWWNNLSDIRTVSLSAGQHVRVRGYVKQATSNNNGQFIVRSYLQILDSGGGLIVEYLVLEDIGTCAFSCPQDTDIDRARAYMGISVS